MSTRRDPDPEWVPWTERLRPGDLGVGDVLPTEEDDARLEPGWNALDDAVEVMSGGEQQMVALARALLLQPQLLILDEPSTGLSPLVVRQIMKTIGTLRERGMGILLVEQNVALAAEVSDRAYVLSVGRIAHEVRAGEWEDFLADDQLVKAYLGS